MAIDGMTPADYERIRSVVHACFPDPASPLSRVTDAMVDHFVHATWTIDGINREHRLQLGIPEPPDNWVPPSFAAGQDDELVIRYYTAKATHRRTKMDGSVFHRFVGEVPSVRLRLPATNQVSCSTAIGIVDLTTSLYLSVADFNARLQNTPGFVPAAEVHVVTPARMDGERFAAIALYLSYANAGDPAPQAYLLEAGLAQGGPRVPFYGATMDTVIVAQTNYQPTPFSMPSHWYRGTLTMAGNEPEALKVEVFIDHLAKQYMQVEVEYSAGNSETISKINPFFLRATAALRVMTIGNSLGMHLAPDVVQPVLAALGRLFPWQPAPP
jgi:hypothetical protein